MGKTAAILRRWTQRRRGSASDQINLITRDSRDEDLADCCKLYEARLPQITGLRLVLPEMWRELVATERMHLFLVENRSAPAEARIVSFNATVFVTDQFCRAAQTSLPAYLGGQLARRCFSRGFPVLGPDEIARANGGEGLNVLLCFAGCAEKGLSRDAILAIREAQKEAFRLAHRGYRIKEFLGEAIGEAELRWLVAGGAHLRRYYPKSFNGRFPPKSSQRPWLVGLTKAEALSNCGSFLSGFFVYTPPRFLFSRSQQILLRRSLMGETSKELAKSLLISPSTVKKRWEAIYERVAEVDPELFPPEIHNGEHATTRGTEHRRHLLQYLRLHPEELRPISN